MVGPEPLERAQSLFVGGVGRYLAERAPYVIGVIVVGAVGLVSAASTKSVDEGPRHFAEKVDASRFLRGNLHTHTRRSDGDHPIEDVVAWYRDHGYAFVAITDHNQRTEPLDLADLERPGSFVVIAGEEVTTYAASGLGRVPVHVNALCHQMTIGGGDFPSIEAALRFAIDSARFQGGVALVNHPNFEWALSASDLSYARGAQLLEIWSGHPSVHAEGDALRPSEESIWEAALEGGGTFIRWPWTTCTCSRRGRATTSLDRGEDGSSSSRPKCPARPFARRWIEESSMRPRARSSGRCAWMAPSSAWSRPMTAQPSSSRISAG